MGSAAKLLSILIVTTLGIIVFVVVVGGIVCITDETYSFREYLTDLAGVYRLFLTAVLGILARAVLPLIEKSDTEAR